MVGALDKILHEAYILTGIRAVISYILQKSIFIQFINHGTIFYDKYITSDNKKKYIDDDGISIFSKQKIKNIYNARYQNDYSNKYYVPKSEYIKYTRILQMYSGRKQRETSFAYLKVSPYCDDDGSSQLRYCLHDAIINYVPIIGGKYTKWYCIFSVHL